MEKDIFLDTTPHPRILSVLAEIEFQPWQCVAELVDNSLDGFLQSFRAGETISSPTVKVAFGRETVEISDNGPGMSVEQLAGAVSAGWTSREGFESLGLYGIGFNIATARLGEKTTILTTRKGDKYWSGVVIDIAAAMNYKHADKKAGFLRKLEQSEKSNPEDSGTRIKVENIKRDWRQNFSSDSWIKSHIREKLARIYGTMLRDENAQPLHFHLHVNERKVSAWEHCVWPEDITVFRKNEGNVPPILTIDQDFGVRYYSTEAHQFVDSPDGLEKDKVITVKERVYGWIGIQRYAHPNDYGIDIIRNGRKIEIACKDFFEWETPDGEIQLEYPIDDFRSGGRIVGEIHLDHGYVHYTKHKFEREHASWGQLLLALRNKEPLTKRSNYGFEGANTSQLGRLFRTFRRNSPQASSGQKYADILFIRDNPKATLWAKEYRKRNSDFLDISKWKIALKESDEVEAPEPAAQALDDGFIQTLDDGATATGSGAGARVHRDALVPEVTRRALVEHNLNITAIGPSGRAYVFEIFEVNSGQEKEFPWAWSSRATPRGIYEIQIDTGHKAFSSRTLGIRDAILAEAAHIIVSEESAAVAGAPIYYGDILARLREQYGTSESLDPGIIQIEVETIRKRLANALAEKSSKKEADSLLSELGDADLKELKIESARGPAGRSMLSHLRLRHLLAIFRAKPESLMLSGCFNRDWVPDEMKDDKDVLSVYQQDIVNGLTVPLLQLAQMEKEAYRNFTKAQLLLARACIDAIREYTR